MDPEDDDISGFEPPPDPTERVWRHPSEIAASRAAFVGLDGPTPSEASSDLAGRPLGYSWPMMAGAAAVLGLCLGGFVIVSGPDSSDLETDIAFHTQVASDGAVGTLGSFSAERDSSSYLHSRDSASVTARPASQVLAGNAAPSTTTANGLVEDLHANSATTSSTLPEAALPPSLTGADLAVSAPGLLQLHMAPSEGAVATGIIIEGLILSSASSLHGLDEVMAFDGQTWMSLQIVATDPHTDVAVLANSELMDSLTPVVTAPEGPSTAPGQVVAVLGAHYSDSTTVAGTTAAVCEVVTTATRAVTENGYEVLGAVTTTCRSANVLGGAALIDDQGHVVGVVVNSADQLTSALPLDIALQIGRSLMDEGWRGGAWLGIHVKTVEDGFLLEEVDPTGPAAFAGLQTGDLITRINGQSLDDLSELLHMLRELGIGDPIEVELERLNLATGELVTITLDIEFTTKLVSS